MDRVNDAWRVDNERILKTSGTRTYKASKREGFRAMLIALTDMGMIVLNQNLDVGYILAKSPSPTPLTRAEWAAVKEIEEPRLRQLVGEEIGDFYAQRAVLEAGSYEVLVNAFFVERPSDLEVSIKVQLEYVGPRAELARRHQPPPTALKYALHKGWDHFERTLFIQRETLQ